MIRFALAVALRTAITALALVVTATPSQAAVIFSFQFDGTPDGTVTPPIVGTGTLTLATDPGTGTFSYTALSPTISFSFTNGDSFTEADLATPAANILLEITDLGNGDRGIRFGGARGGPFGGSMDFTNASGNLSFEPFFGALYFNDTEFGTFQGIAAAQTAGAVPEPATLAVFAGLAGVGGLVARRRKTAA